ncbi:hypothetical protein [Pseudoalteromonas sp. MB47]|uniref:ATP-grasp domain-containing protein n=1 Tax=Pseudoalteromonas sp. MB47 TaxID=2588452 RepID=UPI00140759AB|nr:hypothetical protein [Pseudoalteromonas sp. MB47]NHH89280.1 hypothetical protein [Pseudoalteromonas sp. MB47]
MKIAIHHREGSFSDRWIIFCENNNLDFKVVNAFDNDIIEQVKGCDIFLWHHHHNLFKDVITAKNILYALEHSGVKVFPNFKTGWHFDNKVAQKYLFESINAPVVPSYVFYDKKSALKWCEETSFPKVFKLKGGAGAANVRLVESKKHAQRLIKQAFGRGFPQFNRVTHLKDTIKKYKSGQNNLFSVVKALFRMIVMSEFAKQYPPEKGYIYFQDFIAQNDSDLRVIVIDSKAFAVKRYVRDGDFRASGSGVKAYDRECIDLKCIKIAFEVNSVIDSQSAAFDFIWDENGVPYMVELSYGFAIDFYDPCPGYWDENLKWHSGSFIPQEWIIKSLLK